MTFPSGEQLFALITAPSLAGFCTGLCSFGSAIIIQTMFTFYSVFNIYFYEESASQARFLIAITSLLAISQYPASAFVLYKSKERFIMWEAVVYVSIGLNTVVWLGTFITIVYNPVILSVILGVVLVGIAIWQFVHQSIIGRSVDDERVKAQCRRDLLREIPQTYVTAENSEDHTSQPQSGAHDQIEPESPHTTTSSVPQGSNMDYQPSDIFPTNEPPKMPKSLKPPNNNFNVEIYHQEVGLTGVKPPPHLGYSMMKINVSDDTTALHSGLDSENYSEYGNGLQKDESELLGLSIYRLVKYRLRYEPRTVAMGLAFGSIAGLLGGMFGVNGPPLILYFVLMKFSGPQVRDTATVVFLLHIPSLIIARIIFNVFRADEWLYYIIAMLFSTAGLYFGRWLSPFCDTRLILTLLQFIILGSSIPLTKPNFTDVRGYIFSGMYAIIALALLGFAAWRISRNNLIKEKVTKQHNIINRSNF